jgi:hypothetical protein
MGFEIGAGAASASAASPASGSFGRGEAVEYVRRACCTDWDSGLDVLMRKRRELGG